MRTMNKENRTANSSYKKLAVQWLNEHLCFVSSAVLADSFVLRNRQLLVAAKRQAVKKPLFPLKFLYFPITTTQIKPFKKAVFLGCKFSLAENKL